MPQVPRSNKRVIRFTDEELARLRGRAGLCKQPVARYVRETALGVLPVIPGRRIDNAALSELRRIGNNLNQLAQEANAAAQYPSEARIAAALADLDALAERIGGVAQ